MPTEKPKQNNLDDPEILKLRDSVLRWLDKSKNLSPTIEDLKKPTPKKNLTPVAPKTVKDPFTPPRLVKPLPSLRQRLQTEKPKRHNLRTLVVGIFTALIGVSTLLGIAVYGFNTDTTFIVTMTRYIPLPAAVVNFTPITYYDWQQQVSTLKTFYTNQVGETNQIALPDPQQTKQHVLDRMIDNVILEQAAKKYTIVVNNQEVDAYIKKLADEIGSEEGLAIQVKNLYNWSLSDFKQQIIRPLLLKSHLASAIILDDRLNHQARQTAETVLTEAKTGTTPFETLVRKYSEDITAVQDGDLGFFGRGQLEKSFEDAAFALAPGEVSGVIQTKYGFHIIKVEQVLKNEAGEVTQIRAKQILIRGKDLDNFLVETKKTAIIWQLVRTK